MIQPADAFEVIVTGGPSPRRRYRLFRRLTVGRDRENDLALPDDGKASRQHALITMGRSGPRIEDLRSNNGTFVNDLPVRQMKLKAGDVIRVGNTELEIRRMTPVAEAELPHPSTDVSPWRFTERGDQSTESDNVRDVFVRLRSYALVREVASALQETDSLSEVLRATGDAIFRVTGADRANLVLIDEETGELLPGFARHRNPQVGDIQVTISTNVLERVIRERKPIASADATCDDRFDDKNSIVEFAIRSLLCSPILSGRRVLGAIQIDKVTPQARFGEGDAELLMVIGVLLGLRLDNLRLRRHIQQLEPAERRRPSDADDVIEGK